MRNPSPLWLVLCALAATPPAFAKQACDEQTARLVAKAYTLALPPILALHEREFQELLTENKATFAQDGAATRCMLALGSFLVTTYAPSNPPAPPPRPSQTPSATETYGGQMPQGLENIPGEVDRELSRSSPPPQPVQTTGPAEVGLELLWLADVLPSAAQGDYQRFQSTGTPTRQLTVQNLNEVCQADAALCRQALVALDKFRPSVEEYILGLVRTLP